MIGKKESIEKNQHGRPRSLRICTPGVIESRIQLTDKFSNHSIKVNGDGSPFFKSTVESDTGLSQGRNIQGSDYSCTRRKVLGKEYSDSFNIG